MGKMLIALDEELGDKVRELVEEYVSKIESGEVSGFGWDADTEIGCWNDVLLAIRVGMEELHGRERYGKLTGITRTNP